MSYLQRYRPEDTPPTRMDLMVNLMGKRSPAIDEYFGADGPLAQALTGYKPRIAQIDMAHQVLRTLEQRGTLMVEAGTGTGKSFGMLIPAADWACRTGRTVVVATATLALQDQYRTKDLPLLERVLSPVLKQKYGTPLTWAVAKGRGNYYCQASEGNPDPKFAFYNEHLVEWLDQTDSGDMTELPFEIKQPNLWPWLDANTASADDCPGQKRCPMGETCFFYRGKERASQVRIVVANHSMVALDLMLGGLLLPEHHALLVDEAHQLERYVRSAYEVELKGNTFRRVAKKLFKLGLAQDEGKELNELAQRFEQLLQDHDERAAAAENQATFSIAHTPDIDSWKTWHRKTSEQLRRAADECKIAGEGDDPKAAALSDSAQALRSVIDGVVDPEPGENRVTWLEKDRDGRHSMKISPIDVSKQMAELWKQPCVLASATLTTGDPTEAESTAWDYPKAEMGIGRALTMVVPSPFNWDENCLYILPREGTLVEADIKPRRGERHQAASQRWADRISPVIKNMLKQTEGRAFVLFTSSAVMKMVFDHVAPLVRELGWTCLLQGEYSKDETIRRFREGTCPVLLATSSFWEGVDIAGSQLSAVIIDKLPFPRRGPVEQGKRDLIGREWFAEYDVPLTIQALKQGVGRLIRTETDRGVVAILDPRVRKRYGREILTALPGQALAALNRVGPANIAGHLDGAGSRSPASQLERWAEQALKTLSSADPDRARDKNDVGFSASDSHRGNDLARELEQEGLLSDRQWAAAVGICRKYHKQVGPPPAGEVA